MSPSLLPTLARETIATALTLAEKGWTESAEDTYLNISSGDERSTASPYCCTNTARAVAGSMIGSKPDPVADNQYPRYTRRGWQHYASG